ncbi:hypothetical protein DPEC_G00277480 [Dallia pectoralis]|uniref:Uncharacterized protein n=1 Tax=Dallia pectoralis TaxID=75939 RepID=A0ACC2FM01_DALPE|nr:hypothetical protein DPEC_G00277480 [Dallia pectoralis]
MRSDTDWAHIICCEPRDHLLDCFENASVAVCGITVCTLLTIQQKSRSQKNSDMDSEQNQEVLEHAPESQGHQETKSPLVSPEAEESPINGQGTNTEEHSPKKTPEPVESPKKIPEASAEVGPAVEKSPIKPEPESKTDKVSESASGGHVEPENVQNQELEQQPMPAKTPEPLTLQDPLAGNNVESEPEKMAEHVLESVQLSEQAVSEPVKQLESEGVKELEHVEKPKAPEKHSDSHVILETASKMHEEPQAIKVEAEKPVEAETVKKVDAEKPVEAETVKKVEAEKPVEAETVKKVEAEKPVEAETVKKVEAEKPVEAETVKKVEAEKPVEAETVKVEAEKPVEAETVKKVEAEKPVEAETVKKVEAEKPVEAETVKKVEAEKPVEAETVKKVEAEKRVEPKAVKEPNPETVEGKPVVAEIVEAVESNTYAEGKVEDVKQETSADIELEEQIPVPGTMSFAILEDEQTKATLRTSRTLIVLRGLPGSGKSLLARAIADNYQDLCTVFCADDHGVKPECSDASAEGYKAFDDAVVACCSVGTSAQLIVVDDTNHQHDRLALLADIAEQHRLVAMFLEPRTEWSRDLSKLAKKSHRGLEETQIQVMKVPLEETSIPLFYGWFLVPAVQEKVRCTSMDFLKTLDTLEAFKKHLTDFTGEAEKEVDLEQYFSANSGLHCTTKYCDYGKAEGAKEYAEQTVVKEQYCSASELSLNALFVTPRTVGARVSLTENQLTLWPSDAEKEAESLVPTAASLPAGSRAHVTLGCADGVEPVQTGYDLLEILALQQEGLTGELVEEMELGSLAYFGKGRWLLSLREPISAKACFSSYYGPKKVDPKKDGDKKKKQKCTIL